MIPFNLLRTVTINGPAAAAQRIMEAEESAARYAHRAARSSDRVKRLIGEREQAEQERNQALEAHGQEIMEHNETRAMLRSLAAEHEAMIETADTQHRETEAHRQAISLVFETAPAALTMQQARRRAAVIALIASDNDLDRY